MLVRRRHGPAGWGVSSDAGTRPLGSCLFGADRQVIDKRLPGEKRGSRAIHPDIRPWGPRGVACAAAGRRAISDSPPPDRALWLTGRSDRRDWMALRVRELADSCRIRAQAARVSLTAACGNVR